jgi:hypothetical protein
MARPIVSLSGVSFSPSLMPRRSLRIPRALLAPAVGQTRGAPASRQRCLGAPPRPREPPRARVSWARACASRVRIADHSGGTGCASQRSPRRRESQTWPTSPQMEHQRRQPWHLPAPVHSSSSLVPGKRRLTRPTPACRTPAALLCTMGTRSTCTASGRSGGASVGAPSGPAPRSPAASASAPSTREGARRRPRP